MNSRLNVTCHPTAMRTYFALLSALLLCIQVDAQEVKKHHARINLEFPIQMGIGYEYDLNQKVSLQTQLGLLREPNTSIVLWSLDVVGVDETTNNLLEQAFSSGTVWELGVNYQLSKYYIGIYHQVAWLKGEDTAVDLIEAVLNIDLESRRIRRARGNGGGGGNSITESDITLNTSLNQLGVLVGRKFPIQNQHLILEFGISANVFSSSSLSSADFDLAGVSESMDDYLKDIFSNYGFIPSITVGYEWSF